MLGKVQKLLLKPLVPVVKIQGNIDANTATGLTKSLHSINAARAKALAVVINSPGGAPAQCEIIKDRIRAFCDQHHLPLYTFAESEAGQSALHLLCAGDKVHVSNISLLGSLGMAGNLMSYKNFINSKLHLRRYGTVSNEAMIDNKFAPYKEIKDQDANAAKQIVENFQNKSFEGIVQARKLKDAEKIRDLLMTTLITGEKALQLGLVDKLGTYEAILSREFPEARIHSITMKSKFDRVEEKFASFVTLATSKMLPAILLFLLIKFIIKWSIIIYVWRHSVGGENKNGEEKEAKKTQDLIFN